MGESAMVIMIIIICTCWLTTYYIDGIIDIQVLAWDKL